jgi:hypothetical protein
MAYAVPGIKHIALCKKGTLLTTPTNILIIGSRNNEELNINDETQDDVLERPHIIKRTFKTAEIESRQPTLKDLQNLITFRADQGCDAEILAQPQTSGVDGGCFQFTGNNYMGFKSKYEIAPDKRILAVQLGVSLNPIDAKTLIDAADNATPASLGITNNGIDNSLIRFPWLKYVGTFTQDDIIDYSFLLEETGDNEKLNGRFIGDYIKATISFTFRSATIANMVTEMNEAEGISLTFQQDTSASSSTYEKFIFNSLVLRKKTERKIEAKERYIKATYTGNFTRSQIAFDFSALSGGGTSADGTAGGTVTISM